MPSVKCKKLRYLPYFPKNYWHSAVNFALRQRCQPSYQGIDFYLFRRWQNVYLWLIFIRNLFQCFAGPLSQIVIRRRGDGAFTHKTPKIDHQQKNYFDLPTSHKASPHPKTHLLSAGPLRQLFGFPSISKFKIKSRKCQR